MRDFNPDFKNKRQLNPFTVLSRMSLRTPPLKTQLAFRHNFFSDPGSGLFEVRGKFQSCLCYLLHFFFALKCL